MYKQFKKKYLLLVLTIVFINSYSQQVIAQREIAERVAGHDFPSIAKPWGNCVDFKINKSSEEIIHHDIVWESIGKEKDKIGNRIIGANWTGAYPALSSQFSNTYAAIANKKEALSKNPNIIILAELRWRDYMDSLLPNDHEFWKRDSLGNRVIAKGDKMARTRYLLDTSNIQLVNQLLMQAKCMVDSGIYDGVFLDWFGPSAGFFEKLRNAIGDKYLIITNSNYKYDAERAKYINGAYMECYKTDNPTVLSLWEQTVQSPKVNIVDMMGEANNLEGTSDYKRMRNTTTYTLVHSNGYVLYGDHYHNHHWFDFWNFKLGNPITKEVMIEKDIYKRGFENGIVVNNASKQAKEIEFDTLMKRFSSNEISNKFLLESNDGDYFISIK
ncbi:MAG: hypothetical protein RIR55_715 [Bacteroidota bacterium]